MNFSTPTLLAAMLAALCVSCETTPKPNPDQTKVLRAEWVNPYPKGSYEHFTAEPNYPKTYNVFKNRDVLSSTDGSNARVIIDLGLQRAVLFNGDSVAMDYPIASGKKAFPTPPGDYKIVEKLKADKRSNLYGKIYDAEGNLHKKDADSTKDKVPEGGKFEGALMPYWMRLTWSGVGMHQGRVPRYPASHGCVRIPSGVASTVFAKTNLGTPVSIVP